MLANQSGAPETKPEEAWPAQRQAVREEIGWTGASEAHDAILTKLQPVAVVGARCIRAEEGSTPPAVMAELEAFEAWFEGAHGTSFYALFDQYFQEVPVVDF